MKISLLSLQTQRNTLLKWLKEHLTDYRIQIEDRCDDLGCIAVIGPKAQDVVRIVAGDDIVGLPYLGFEHNMMVNCLLCRIGYTGEYEYRFILPREKCDHLVEQIMEAGREYDIS